jgi:hypothetical protein
MQDLPGYHDHEDGPGAPFSRSALWAPGESGLAGDEGSYEENAVFKSWGAFRDEWGLPDVYNLVADFYFEVDFDSEPCDSCGMTGFNPETKRIADEMSRAASTGAPRLTQDEVDLLWEGGHLHPWGRPAGAFAPAADRVNAALADRWPRVSPGGYEREMLVGVRARARGVYGPCPVCGGTLERRLGPDRLQLQTWWLHPRFGASRAVTVRSVEEHDLPHVAAFMRAAHERNAENFRWAIAHPARGGPA